LDGHEKFGTILVVEQLQVIGKWEKYFNILKSS
jgi:hypothetical protein